MTFIVLLETAFARANDLYLKYPKVDTIESIIKQIRYLIDLEKGVVTDRSRLREIVLGIQAAREIDPLDNDLAEMLYTISEKSKMI